MFSRPATELVKEDAVSTLEAWHECFNPYLKET